MDEREVFEATLANAVGAMGLSLDEPQRACMWRHFSLVVEVNRQFNLTRITAPAEAAVKHYADSLTLLTAGWVDREAALSVLDVGTGAGFPAVPLAVVCPKWHVTAIDGTGKKARFVGDAAGKLGLANLTAVQARAADLAKQAGAGFDLIVLRAVTQLAPGIEETYRLLNATGAIVFYKSGTCSEEELAWAAVQARRRRLNGPTIHTLQLPTPDGSIERRLIRYARGIES